MSTPHIFYSLWEPRTSLLSNTIGNDTPMHAKSETDGPSLTWAHNLFVIWAWISYFG